MLRLCVALFSSVLALSSLAAPQVFVVGLFPGAAVLNVDGQRKLVRVGQTGPQGVQVVSADSRKAVLRIDGVERTYELSREYNEAGYSAPQRQSFSIARGTGGHYWVAGSVNGQNMQFLVDTGATSIAMNENEARRLGIDYRVDGKPMVASTASGT
ncbi:TIGR02281 family clan AA aspartic protease, partial [Pseudomonas aeruginosa]|nr:TIGR02281 family clan AA aspartic protease [Pseudomonas aeruginosa]